MIFLSHNYKDKDVVGPIAVSLANKYGKDNVFYDSWSISPGDSIINEMNKGLSNCKFFFFFISQNSLNSGMVGLEWQSALYNSIKENIKFIPIKIDNSKQPTILIDKVYIDMYNIGIPESLQKIIDVLDNNDSNMYNENYSNVYCELELISDFEIKLVVKAKKFKEHTPTINISFSNNLSDIDFQAVAASNQKNFAHSSVNLSGTMENGDMTKGIRTMSQDLSPDEPIYFNVKNIKKEKINNLKVWLVNGKQGILIGEIK
ncbi:MAG: toll/interleukin-1 receptor domain-containing protein [Arcobacter skirrowii]|nr:toll/interleukin-1 receptor domain-containing protein [Aliarcobacter skirrowii]